MKPFIVVIVLFLCLFSLAAYPQEEITITTFYPSPYGVYNEMDIHDTLHFRDPGGTDALLDLNIDDSANLHLGDNGTSPSGYHIIFDDVNRPFCYLQRYGGSSGTTWCANNYVACNFLKADKTPANPASLPASGYYVCIRGWQTVP